MRRNLIAGLLIAGGLALMASALPGLGLINFGAAPAVTQSIPALSDPLSPPHQHPKFLPGTNSTAAGPNQVVAYLSIPRLGVKNAPIFDRGVDRGGNMEIAKGYAIKGSVFGRLQDLRPGDEVQVTAPGGSPVSYRVTARSIVAPTAVQILQSTSDVRLTLFTCWPNWVDTQRVVVTAMPTSST